jgi:hypothetical protein
MTKHFVKGNWYIEWNLLSHHEQCLVEIGLQLPTKKDKTFFLSLSLFWCSIFWLDINYQKDREIINWDKYAADLFEAHPNALARWFNKPYKPTKDTQDNVVSQ